MDNLIREYINTEKQLIQKYEKLKFGEQLERKDLMKKYKPLLDPLHALIGAKVAAKKVPVEKVEEAETEDGSYEDARDDLFGDISGKYLKDFATNRVKVDNSFGIRIDEDEGMYIGDSHVEIRGNDVVLKDGSDLSYVGTEGLWELLTLAQPVHYTRDDLKNYEEIVLHTRAYRNPQTNRVKASGGYKYTKIIKPILDKQDITSGSGFGLSKISINRPKEYVYWNSLDELLDRLCILYGEIKSGNTNPILKNEIVNIIQEFKELR